MQVEVTYTDLRDYGMPLYDGDMEAENGVPENALRLRELMKAHDGLLLACPEYNSSITAVLKNTIDWASRPRAGETDLVCFKGKVINLVSASPGKWGGLRGLVTVRSILSNMGCIVLPNQFCLSFSDKAFNNEGSLQDEKLAQFLQQSCVEFAEAVNKFST